jgi:hypothetical protein
LDVPTQIISQLIIKGYLARKDALELMDPQVRKDVEDRLKRVGLSLVSSAYSEYYGMRLTKEVESDPRNDWPSNYKMDEACYALLVILWAKLILPKRVSKDEERSLEVNKQKLLVEDKNAWEKQILSVSWETLYAEFGKKLGGKTKFNLYIGQLKRMGFIQYTKKEHITAGPIMEVLIDGHKMASYIRDSCIAELLTKKKGEEKET